MLENGKEMPFNIFLKVIHAERNLRIYSSLGKNNNHHKGTKPTHRPPNPEHIREQRACSLGEQKGALIYSSNQIPEGKNHWLHPALKLWGRIS